MTTVTLYRHKSGVANALVTSLNKLSLGHYSLEPPMCEHDGGVEYELPEGYRVEEVPRSKGSQRAIFREDQICAIFFDSKTGRPQLASIDKDPVEWLVLEPVSQRLERRRV